MVPVSYSTDEHIIMNITNIMSIFSQFFTQYILGTHTSGTKKDSQYYASSRKNKTVIIYLFKNLVH